MRGRIRTPVSICPSRARGSWYSENASRSVRDSSQQANRSSGEQRYKGHDLVSRRPCAALAVSRVYPGLKVAGEQHQVEQAVADALRLRAISLDAVKMLSLAGQENRRARLDLTFYLHLPANTVLLLSKGLFPLMRSLAFLNTQTWRRRAAGKSALNRSVGNHLSLFARF